MAESTVIISIRSKIERLVSENRKLREDYGKAAAQRDRLKAENRDMAVKVEELEKRIAILELKEGMSGGSNSKKARARVNRLMREVDKCIALLNR